MSTSPQPPVYLTSAEAAAHLRVSPKTFANWRSGPDGPPAVNAVGHPRFRREDLDAWLAGRGRTPAKARRAKTARA